ncbi:MAG TPA: hypothetical protein P5121_04475 [Caldilineaceae bacterium]|nr:hypothetical protein [Caldilineaceae bacterium]
MTQPETQWPDPLQHPDARAVEANLVAFWQLLAQLPDLLNRQEYLLADRLTHQLRSTVLEMMLALNGIRWPRGTRHLNSYLSAQQRAAIEKTMVLPATSVEGWIGRAVALLVIYRWYAPQLVDAFALVYPRVLEEQVWQQLQTELAEWPLTVTTDD